MSFIEYNLRELPGERTLATMTMTMTFLSCSRFFPMTMTMTMTFLSCS